METEKKYIGFRPRLSLDIDETLKNQIKAQAALRNVSIKSYVIGAILDRIRNEKKYE